MAAELRLAAPAACLPLVAGALLASCRGDHEVAANVAAPVAKAPVSPLDRAQQLVRARVDGAIGFDGLQLFRSGGADVVCGAYRRADGAPFRFIAVGEEDVFVEGDFQGDFGQAAAEACRNG